MKCCTCSWPASLAFSAAGTEGGAAASANGTAAGAAGTTGVVAGTTGAAVGTAGATGCATCGVTRRRGAARIAPCAATSSPGVVSIETSARRILAVQCDHSDGMLPMRRMSNTWRQRICVSNVLVNGTARILNTHGHGFLAPGDCAASPSSCTWPAFFGQFA